LIFTPVLQYSDPGNWNTYPGANLIVWPGNSLTPPTGQATLEGVTLRIGVIETPVFTIVSRGSGGTTVNLTGYAIDLIELLRSQMNFIPDIQLAPANETYSGLIEAVANGVYDIVVGDVTVTSARRKIVDFSNSIFDNSLRLLVRKTYRSTPDPLSFLKPFSVSLWLTFLSLWICGSILFCFIERETNHMLQNRSIMSQIAMSLWYCIGHCIGHGVDFHVSTASGRLLTVGLYMLSLVLIASYTANLASDLTILKSQNILTGIDDLKNGIIPPNRIGIRVGTAAVDYYLKQISNGNPNFYPLESLEETYDSLLKGIIDVAFTDIGIGEYITNNVYCNLTLIGDNFDSGVFGIVLPKYWIYTEQLDINILSTGETGILDNLKVKWFQTSICPDTSETATAIEVGSMAGLFAAFGLKVILSLLLFAWKKRHFFTNCSFITRDGIQLSFRKRTYNVNQSNHIQNPTFPLSNI
jgi:ABC-type amino acid transport substrate-binding protein